MQKIIIPTTNEMIVSEKYESRKNSNFKNYLNCLFEKPWGYEYLTYQTDKIGIWILHVLKQQKTSLHCHFKKDSLLIVLSGSFKIEIYNSYYIINEGLTTWKNIRVFI
jgi:mannose-6-phosphate isomerase-like protein (cupin superfamily)